MNTTGDLNYTEKVCEIWVWQEDSNSTPGFATGWLIVSDLIITAAHVFQDFIRALKANAPISIQVRFRGKDSTKLSGNDLVWYGPDEMGVDVAVIRCTSCHGVTPIGLPLEIAPEKPIKWHSAGFPKIGRPDPQECGRDIKRRTVDFSGDLGGSREGDQWHELNCPNGPSNKHGFSGASGSPVIVTESSFVAGVITEVDDKNWKQNRLAFVPTWVLLTNGKFRQLIGYDDILSRIENKRRSLAAVLEKILDEAETKILRTLASQLSGSAHTNGSTKITMIGATISIILDKSLGEGLALLDDLVDIYNDAEPNGRTVVIKIIEAVLTLLIPSNKRRRLADLLATRDTVLLDGLVESGIAAECIMAAYDGSPVDLCDDRLDENTRGKPAVPYYDPPLDNATPESDAQHILHGLSRSITRDIGPEKPLDVYSSQIKRALERRKGKQDRPRSTRTTYCLVRLPKEPISRSCRIQSLRLIRQSFVRVGFLDPIFFIELSEESPDSEWESDIVTYLKMVYLG